MDKTEGDKAKVSLGAFQLLSEGQEMGAIVRKCP
jgi:hypothetical protein